MLIFVNIVQNLPWSSLCNFVSRLRATSSSWRIWKIYIFFYSLFKASHIDVETKIPLSSFIRGFLPGLWSIINSIFCDKGHKKCQVMVQLIPSLSFLTSSCFPIRSEIFDYQPNSNLPWGAVYHRQDLRTCETLSSGLPQTPSHEMLTTSPHSGGGRRLLLKW